MALTLPILFMLAGCGDHAHDEHTTTPPAVTQEAGKRWPLDDHTRAVMAETRATLDSAQITTVDDAKALGVTLQEQLDRLIGGCTMTGPAHDALHGFLTAYMPAVAALQKVSDLTDAQSQVTALRVMVVDQDSVFE